jgi:hypothetical protein
VEITSVTPAASCAAAPLKARISAPLHGWSLSRGDHAYMLAA